MSKVIEDAMYRAGLTAQGCWDEMDEYDKTAIETFGELLIEECLVAIRHHSLRDDDMGAIIARAVEKHFEEK